jgi:hypothetical protein
MASLDNLQPDQRAVLQMVLQRGRSYDEIANLLGIDRAAVRQRALDALDALTPMAVIPGPERALVTDYLLGQLPAMVAEQVLVYLGASEPDREWGLALSRVLAPLAPGDMPEIPVGAPVGADDRYGGLPHEADTLWPAESVPPPEPVLEPELVPEPEPVRSHEPASEPESVREHEPVSEPEPAFIEEEDEPEAGSQPRRRATAPSGHLWVWGGLTVAIMAAVVVVVVATSGSSSSAHHHRVTSSTVTMPTATHTTPTATRTTPTATRTTPTATRTTPTLRRLALLSLGSPTGASGTVGVAQVVRAHGIDSVVITAQGVPANTAHDAYAVWLSNSLADSVLIGWVPNVVGGNGVLSTEGTLPAAAGRFHRLLVTLETQAKPTEPGEIVLAGVFREHG